MEFQTEKHEHFVRIYLRVQIDNVDSNDFGNYDCYMGCKFTNPDRDQRIGCLQKKRISLVSEDWRLETLLETVKLNLMVIAYDNHTYSYRELTNPLLVYLEHTINHATKDDRCGGRLIGVVCCRPNHNMGYLQNHTILAGK